MTTRKVDHYVYAVTGSSEFPIDMLRYDQVWPKSETDAARVAGTFERRRTPGPRTILVCGRRAPTSGRWESFGWTVAEERAVAS